MRTPVLLATSAAVLLVGGGCTMHLDERATGTAIGAGVGAVTGALVGGSMGAPGVGAGVGAAAGGTAGYFIGNHIKRDRERQEQIDATRPRASAREQVAPPVATADVVPAPARVAPPPPPSPAPAFTAGNPAEASRMAYEAGRRATSASEALRYYDEAIRLDPSRPEPHNARGMVLAWQGRTEEAKREYAQALAVDPGYRPAIDNLQRLTPR